MKSKCSNPSNHSLIHLCIHSSIHPSILSTQITSITLLHSNVSAESPETESAREAQGENSGMNID